MEDYCKSCEHDRDIGFCDKCLYNHILEERGIPPTKYEAKPKPITNADRIRSMSDEEFSYFLFGIQCAPASRPKEWLDWLRQEVNDA